MKIIFTLKSLPLLLLFLWGCFPEKILKSKSSESTPEVVSSTKNSPKKQDPFDGLTEDTPEKKQATVSNLPRLPDGNQPFVDEVNFTELCPDGNEALTQVNFTVGAIGNDAKESFLIYPNGKPAYEIGFVNTRSGKHFSIVALSSGAYPVVYVEPQNKFSADMIQNRSLQNQEKELKIPINFLSSDQIQSNQYQVASVEEGGIKCGAPPTQPPPPITDPTPSSLNSKGVQLVFAQLNKTFDAEKLKSYLREHNSCIKAYQALNDSSNAFSKITASPGGDIVTNGYAVTDLDAAALRSYACLSYGSSPTPPSQPPISGPGASSYGSPLLITSLTSSQSTMISPATFFYLVKFHVNGNVDLNNLNVQIKLGMFNGNDYNRLLPFNESFNLKNSIINIEQFDNSTIVTAAIKMIDTLDCPRVLTKAMEISPKQFSKTNPPTFNQAFNTLGLNNVPIQYHAEVTSPEVDPNPPCKNGGTAKSPLILDLSSEKNFGFATNSLSEKVIHLDLDGDYKKEKLLGWPKFHQKLGFLLFGKIPKNGQISGSQLIGHYSDFTILNIPREEYLNGFQALQKLDMNNDRYISNDDLYKNKSILSQLSFWQDFNQNGKVDPKELSPLEKVAPHISLSIDPIRGQDQVKKGEGEASLISEVKYGKNKRAILSDLFFKVE